MKFIDDKSNRLTWWNRNYFYVGTFLIVATLVFVYVFFGGGWATAPNKTELSYFDFTNLLAAFKGNFSHGNWAHLLGNSMGVVFAGLYLERQMGSINFVLLTLAGCMLSAMASVAVDLFGPAGFSCVMFFLFACVLIDYLFSFNKQRRNKTNIILGAFVLLFFYFVFCGLDEDGFYFYPYQLITNSGHYAGFFVGLLVALMINVAKLKIIKQSVAKLDVELKGGEKAQKIVYRTIAIVMAVVSVFCLILAGVASGRQTITLNLYDGYRNYSASYETNKDDRGLLIDYLKEYVYSFDTNTDEYVVEVYLDEYYSQAKNDLWQLPDGYGIAYENIYNYNGNVPLTKDTKYNYYLRAYKAYGISFAGNLVLNLNEVDNLINHTIIPINGLYYSTTFRAWDFVRQNANYSFKLDKVEGRKSVTVTYLNSLNEIVVVNPDYRGVYTIENVSEDLVINLNY